MRKILLDYSNIDNSESTSEIRDNNSKVKKTKGMYEYIDEVMKRQKGQIGLGVHALRKEKVKNKSVDEILKKICESGLDIKKGSSILATVSSLGVNSELKNYQKEALKNYRLGSEMAENGVIVLVPTILEGNGEELYVGFPGMDTNAVGNNHKTSCILDLICCGDNDHGMLPKEFILGYFKNENGKKIFKKNTKHFIEMNNEEKGNFIKELSDRLTEKQRKISEYVIAGDMENLEQLSIEMCGNRDGISGENTVIRNAMIYINKYAEKDEHDESEKGNSRKIKPRVLLNAYKNIKFSDLSEAKGVLREKTKEPEKDENENKHELH